MLPKSITTAIGMGVSEELGGYVTISVAVIIITGVLGNMAAEFICKLFRIANSIGILCKRSLEAGDIANVNIRQHIGNFASVFCITATMCVIHSSGIILVMRNLNGQVGTCV